MEKIQVTIRKWTASDKKEFLQMGEEFYHSDAVTHVIEPAQMERSFEEAVNGSPYIQGFIIEADSKTAGYGIVYPYYSNEAGCHCLMLEEIYVRPEFQGMGIGKTYLKRIAGVYKREFGVPVQGLKLEINPENVRAEKLYRNMGFEELGYFSMVAPVK